MDSKREEFERLYADTLDLRQWTGSGNRKGQYIDDKANAAWSAWNSALASVDAQPEQAAPGVPEGFTIKYVEGHGWIIDPPNGSRWVAFENTPAGDFMEALIAAPAAPSVATELDAVDAQKVRDEALEEAAKVCDDAERHNLYGVGDGFTAPEDCAAKIRSLQSQAIPSTEKDAEDARRYRWLRDRFTYDHIRLGRNGYHYDAEPIPGDGMELDAAIDAALADAKASVSAGLTPELLANCVPRTAKANQFGGVTMTYQEIKEFASALESRLSLAAKQKVAESLSLIGEMRDNGVAWHGQNPHAHPVGTKFYAAIAAAAPMPGQEGE